MSSSTANPVDRYSFAGDRTSRENFLRRTATKNAAFFLPYLEPGTRLLDCGCGPGSITLGLAGTVAPGEVVGVDIDVAALQIAQENADKEGITNARFESGNVYELPFPDHSFDAVFSHAVLQHLREPVRALREMRRVLKPGGVIGIRNDDMDGLILAPADALLQEVWGLLTQFIASNGGNAQGAKHSRAWLHQAGFSEIVASASYECAGTPNEIAALGASMAARSFAPVEQNPLLKAGVITSERLLEMGAAWKAWGERPDAFYAKCWCEAIGRA